MSRAGSGRNLYRRGGTYWARVQIAGKDVRRSLRTSNRAEALKRLQGIMQDADRMRFGEGPRRRYSEVVGAWADAGFGGLKPKTIKRYKCSLRQMHDIFGGLYLDQLTKRKIGEYVTARSKQKATNATIRRDLTALSSMLTYAGGMGWTEENPAKDWNRDIIRERKKPFIRTQQEFAVPPDRSAGRKWSRS